MLRLFFCQRGEDQCGQRYARPFEGQQPGGLRVGEGIGPGAQIEQQKDRRGLCSQALCEVEQQVEGRRISPLHVIEKKHQRTTCGPSLEETSHGLEQATVPQRLIRRGNGQIGRAIAQLRQQAC